MQIVYLDCDDTGRKEFLSLCADIKVTCFKTVSDALQFIGKEKVDIVFSEASLADSDIFSLSDTLKEKMIDTRIVLVTEEEGYAEKAFEHELFGYIKRPCTSKKIERVLHRYKKHKYSARPEVVIKTFGRFDVFVGGKAIHFSNKKAKELLALLVDRSGGFVTMEQVIDVLWENRAFDECTKTLYRIALKSLRDTLSAAGCSDIIVEKRGQRRIDKEKVSCDYFDFTSEPKKYSYTFNDEYMIDYSWSEFTLAKIVKIYEKNCI